MPSIPPRRCPRHNLAIAPDGQCVVCRRAEQAVEIAAEPERTSSVLPLLATMLLCVAAGGAAWAAQRSGLWSPPPSAASASAPNPQTDLSARKPVSVDDEAEPTDAQRLADAQRMLAQAEVERRELERATAQHELDRQTDAEAQRKREEEARDLKRHEAVKRDLASLGLASARRKVDITMYSTSWCGVCKQARAYMQENSIPFTDLDVEHDDAARARAHTLNPRASVPTIAIDDDVLIGFSPDSLEARITRAARRRNGS